jgi:hypothetical protein
LGKMLLQQFIKRSNQCLGLFGPTQNDHVDKSRQHIFGNQVTCLKCWRDFEKNPISACKTPKWLIKIRW